MSDPKVSVVIPVYNGERFVVSAVESALAQSYQNIELLIVNDGSTDGSREKLLPYLDLPKVRYIEQKNRGVAAARNAGIENSTGELIAFLDQDDLWLPKKLAIQVRYLNEHPNVPLVHANQGHIDDNANPVEFTWPTDAEGHCLKALFVENRIAVLTVLLRKTCLDEIGVLNEDLSGADDYELWLRIARRFPIGHINEKLALYRFHDANVSRDHFAMTRTDIAAIESFVGQFPDVYEKLGRQIVNSRRAELHFQLGGWYMWKSRDLRMARRHLIHAMSLRPHHFATYRLFLWCCLSPNQHRTLSWYWHKMKTFPGAAKF